MRRLNAHLSISPSKAKNRKPANLDNVTGTNPGTKCGGEISGLLRIQGGMQRQLTTATQTHQST